MADENSGPKQGGHRFAPGVSGDPAGKPKGARHMATQLAEKLLDGQAEEIIQAVIRSAIGGDVAAQRLCLERIISPRRDRPVLLDIGKVETAADAVQALSKITDAMASGEITPDEAGARAVPIEKFTKAVELVELEARIAALEAGARHESD